MKFKSLLVTVLLSFALLFSLLCLIWWNEQVGYKAKFQAKVISKGTVNVDINNVDADNDGKLVYLKGDLSFDKESNGDYLFDVYVDSPKLVRVVEKYQYKEIKQSNINGTEKVSYEKVWSPTYINSKKFVDKTYENPTDNKYLSQTFYADNIRIGKYKLSESLLSQIEADVQYTDLQEFIANAYDLRIDGYYYTTSIDPSNPQIGDLRISFKYSDTNKGSIISMQSYDSFIIFTARGGRTYNKFVGRLVNKNAMLNMINKDDDLLRWELRFSLMAMLFALLIVSFRPVTKYTERIRFFGRINLPYLIILCVLSTIILYSIEASLVWLLYSPLVSFVLLLIAAFAGLIVYFTGKKNEILTREGTLFNYTPEVVGSINGNALDYGPTRDQKEEDLLKSVIDNVKE